MIHDSSFMNILLTELKSYSLLSNLLNTKVLEEGDTSDYTITTYKGVTTIIKVPEISFWVHINEGMIMSEALDTVLNAERKLIKDVIQNIHDTGHHSAKVTNLRATIRGYKCIECSPNEYDHTFMVQDTVSFLVIS